MTEGDFLSQKIPHKYFCENCNYKTFSKKDYNKHLSTEKHKKRTNGYEMITLDDQKEDLSLNNRFVCSCGNKYKYKQGLHRHKTKCQNNANKITNNTQNIDSELVVKILNDNQEMRQIILKQQQQICDLIPQVNVSQSHNNNSFNTTNNKLNINVFLNEKCKDALNMGDFIDSIKVSLEQLDYTKKHGLEKGLTKTILDNISKLTLYERPIHCTDTKRETLYIKDNDNWEKDKNKEKIKKAIKYASNKNYHALKDWKDSNPDFMEKDDKQEYFAKTISSIGQSTNKIDNKVIKNLCKETYVKDSIDEE